MPLYLHPLLSFYKPSQGQECTHSFAVFPLLLLVPLFGAVPGLVGLFLLGFALGQAGAVVGVMLLRDCGIQ